MLNQARIVLIRGDPQGGDFILNEDELFRKLVATGHNVTRVDLSEKCFREQLDIVLK